MSCLLFDFIALIRGIFNQKGEIQWPVLKKTYCYVLSIYTLKTYFHVKTEVQCAVHQHCHLQGEKCLPLGASCALDVHFTIYNLLSTFEDADHLSSLGILYLPSWCFILLVLFLSLSFIWFSSSCHAPFFPSFYFYPSRIHLCPLYVFVFISYFTSFSPLPFLKHKLQLFGQTPHLLFKTFFPFQSGTA